MEKVIIVGGGISGLTAAAKLAKKGVEVSLFEANDKLGGCCATTNLEGYVFNDGAMYLVFPTVLDQIFDEIGLSRPDELPLRKITKNSTTLLPVGVEIRFGEGLDWDFVRGEPAVDPVTLQAELEAFLSRWEPVVDLMVNDLLLRPFSYTRLLRKGWRYLSKLGSTVERELNRNISDPAMRAALAGALLFAGLPAAKLPANALIGLVALLSDGFYLPEGGMGKIPEALQRALTLQGVDVFLGKPVEQIVIEGGRVTGCKVGDGEFYQCDALISTAGGLMTYSKLIDRSLVPARTRKKVANAPLSHTAISLQLGITTKMDAPSHMVNMIPYVENQYQIFDFETAGDDCLCYSVPTITMPELAPAGGSVVEMYLPVAKNIPLAHWDQDRKTALREKALRILGKQFPGQPLDIAVARTRSPRDFRDQMRLYQGALYGITPAAMPQDFFSHKTPIPGLYLAGQTTYPGYGIVSAGISGLFAAKAVLEEK